MAKRTSKKSPDAASVVAEIDALELDFEYTPSEADGDMFGGAPAKKAQHFWPSAKRLIGLLRPERAKMIVVVALGDRLGRASPSSRRRFSVRRWTSSSTACIGAQLPAGVALHEVIAGLRADGNDQFADMLQGTTSFPAGHPLR